MLLSSEGYVLQLSIMIGWNVGFLPGVEGGHILIGLLVSTAPRFEDRRWRLLSPRTAHSWSLTIPAALSGASLYTGAKK